MKPDRWAFGMIDSWRLDVKLGLRMLVKYPGLALAGGAGIAVAVAISASAFSIIHGNFRASSLPLDEGERVVALDLWDSAAGKPERRSLYEFHLWRQALKSVGEISAFRTLTVNLIVPGAPPESVRVAAVSASSFGVARVRPLLGRYLTEEDERAGAPPTVVIGESVWRNRFAAEPGILGQTIQLGATQHSIVGVMPKGFAFPINHQFWAPLNAGSPPPEPLNGPDLMVFGRLAPGSTVASAQAELSAIGQRTALAFPKIYAQVRPRVAAYTRSILGMHGDEDEAGLVVMQGLLISLLVLVCLNVAILVYTRTAMRQSEIGLRTALGAGRGRIVAQLFIEALVLSAGAALGGVVIAAFAFRQVNSATQHIASELPFWLSFRLSPEAVLYAGALGVVAAAIVGIVPGLQATGRQAQTVLRIVGAAGSEMRLGKTWTILIVVQVGFGVAILPPAALSSWKDLKAGLAGPGFAAEEFLSAQLGMDSGSSGLDRYPTRQAELMRRLEAEPRVVGVTVALAHPGDEPGARIEAEGASGDIHEARFNRVDVDFFRTFEVPILAGRTFESRDVARTIIGEHLASGTVVVNQPLAWRLFGGSALGRRIRYLARNAEPGPWHEIVGVVSEFPTGVSPGMRDSPLRVYHAAAPEQLRPAAIALRMRRGSPSTFSRRLHDIAVAVDPELYLRDIRSLDESLRREQWIVRLEAGVFLAVTVSVLLLCSAGIYALMSFTVSKRRKEIGIRMALGASRQRIIAGIFSRALMQLAAGAALGAALNIGLEKASGGGLMQGDAPAMLLAVSFAMMTVGFLAALGPARRSLRIEPTEALREQ